MGGARIVAGGKGGLGSYFRGRGISLSAGSAYAYDNQNRLTSLTHTPGTVPLGPINYAFGYDVASRMTSLATPDGTSALAYDNDNQLTSSTVSGPASASLADEAYGYDANGNRASASLGTGVTGSDITGGNNQLQSDATYNYTYDNEGNLATRARKDGSGSDVYAWDDRNRLIQVQSKNATGVVTQTVTYAYDDTNDRIRKTVTDGSGATTLDERYVYDSNGNLLLVLDGPTGGVTERYLNGNTENQVLASETGIAGASAGTTHWLLADFQGSVRDVVDNSGAGLDHLIYDSFGNIVSQTSAVNTPRLGHTGQQADAETGFNYDHARYYNPGTGTFLNQDPKGFKAGDQNLYRYVDNSPLDKTDPTGMDSSGSTAQPSPSQSPNSDYGSSGANGSSGGDGNTNDGNATDGQSASTRGTSPEGNSTPPDVNRENEAPTATFFLTKSDRAQLKAGFTEDEVATHAKYGLFVPGLRDQLRKLGLDPDHVTSRTVHIDGLDADVTYYTDGNKSVYALRQGWVVQPNCAIRFLQLGGGTYVGYGVVFFNNLNAINQRANLLSIAIQAGSAGVAVAGVGPLVVNGLSNGISGVTAPAPQAPIETPSPAAESAGTLSKADRLAKVFDGVGNAPAATTADEAMAQMNSTLEGVEDAYSGVPKDPNPPRAATPRMYPPQGDSIVRNADGSITATSAGHVTTYGPNGSITVTQKGTGRIVFQKPGRG